MNLNNRFKGENLERGGVGGVMMAGKSRVSVTFAWFQLHDFPPAIRGRLAEFERFSPLGGG